MTTFRERMLVVAGALVLALGVPLAAAQDDPDGVRGTATPITPEQAAAEWLDSETPLYQSDFGTSNTGITTLTWQAFLPRTSTTTFDARMGTGRWVTGGASSYLYAALDRGMIPNGAEITQIRFYIDDSDATNDVLGRLCWEATDSRLGGNPDSSCPFSVTSNGSPGPGRIFGDPDTQILYRQDIDGDSVTEAVSYHLSVDLPSQSRDNVIHQVRIFWERRVSNPPASASFNDVPSSSGIFPFVEALADSGVTAGCGGGNYCPDDAVTRGQMAVFLAKALGLNWDWTQTEPNP